MSQVRSIAPFPSSSDPTDQHFSDPIPQDRTETLSANLSNEYLYRVGFDTTSTVLAACLFYLSRYPEIYRRVTNEVCQAFSSASELTDRSKLNTCRYLRACIDESMRMAPPIGSSPFREVEAGGIVVDGRYLPAGCDVGTGIYSIHHNPKYFPDPFTFIPERWLESVNEDETISDPEAVKRAHSAFTPFSKGPRVCIGKGLALMELTSILANMIYRLDFRTVGGEEGRLGAGMEGMGFGRDRVKEYQLYDHVTAAKEGPMLQFRARNTGK